MTDDGQPRTQWCGEPMTAPIISREELPTDEVTLAYFIYSIRSYGEAEAKAKLLWPMLSIAQAPTNRDIHDVIASALQIEGTTYSGIQRAVRDIQALYASPIPSTGLPAPAPICDICKKPFKDGEDYIMTKRMVHLECARDRGGK